MGELLTIWTVRLAVGCYLGRYLVETSSPNRIGHARTIRILWTAGCGLYVLHVLCAFAFVHGWSHAKAYAHTAEQTQAVIGWDWGGGLYFNYLFTVVWIADVVRMWRNDVSRTRWILAAELFMAFMVVNATIVFGPPAWRWIGVGFVVVGGCIFMLRKRAAN